MSQTQDEESNKAVKRNEPYDRLLRRERRSHDTQPQMDGHEWLSQSDLSVTEICKLNRIAEHMVGVSLTKYAPGETENFMVLRP